MEHCHSGNAERSACGIMFLAFLPLKNIANQECLCDDKVKWKHVHLCGKVAKVLGAMPLVDPTARGQEGL